MIGLRQGSFWELPPLRRFPAIWGKIGKTEYVIKLAQESCYSGAQLHVLPSPDQKIALGIAGECLGVLPAKPGRAIVLDSALPILNYGPTMKGMIERALDANGEKELSGLLFGGLDYDVSFKPLEHYARYYFAAGDLSLHRSVMLVNLLLEGIGQVERDGWFSLSDKDWLLAGISVDKRTSPVTTERMSEEGIKRVLTGTIGFSQRWGRPFSDRQFVLVEQLYRALAAKKNLVLSPASLASIRRDYYSSRRESK